MSQGHVYVGDAYNDPVTDAPALPEITGGASIGGEIGLLAGIPGALTGAVAAVAAEWYLNHTNGSAQIYFGTNPADPKFGATTFKVNPGTITTSHLKYWDTTSGSCSLTNMAHIVAGQTNLITKSTRTEKQLPRKGNLNVLAFDIPYPYPYKNKTISTTAHCVTSHPCIDLGWWWSKVREDQHKYYD